MVFASTLCALISLPLAPEGDRSSFTTSRSCSCCCRVRVVDDSFDETRPRPPKSLVTTVADKRLDPVDEDGICLVDVDALQITSVHQVLVSVNVDVGNEDLSRYKHRIIVISNIMSEQMIFIPSSYCIR